MCTKFYQNYSVIFANEDHSVTFANELVTIFLIIIAINSFVLKSIFIEFSYILNNSPNFSKGLPLASFF